MKQTSKKDLVLRSSAASLALGLIMMSTQTFAQAAPPSTAVPDETTSEPDTIIVTGSRIVRPDLESSSPVAVVSANDIALKANSANIENVLNDLPQVTATQSSTSNNPGGGVATVNLRNLGSQRTLVLVNGRRYMSYDVNQVVDLNTVPSSLIERVDVLTGGASAVYGSDAVGGVVNFVLKQDFSGVEIGSSYGLTERGDGQEWNVNGTIGANFDDNRGNVTLFADYTKRRPTFAGQRSFSANALSDNEDGSPPFAAGGSPSVPQGRITVPGLGAALGSTAGNGCAAPNTQVFNQNGSTKCYTAADGYNFNPINYLQVPQERFLVSAQARYEINEHFTPYMEAQFANNRVTAQLAATPIGNGTPFGDGVIGGIPLQVNSPFFAPALRTALTSLDTDGDGYVTANFNYRTTQIGPRANFDERNAFRVVAGMKGDIAGGFSYDGYYMYARTKNSQRQLGNVAIDRFKDAVTTAFDANGNLVCRSGAPNCAPANIFGLNNLSQAAIDYISVGATNLEEYTTQVASFAITNPSLFDLGAGGVGLAFGAEYRSERGQITPDTYLASGNVAGFNPGQPTGGGYHTRDFFAEVNVPLLRENIVYRLNVDAKARQTKYSNAPGTVYTWALGVELAPIKDITFRGNYQRAIRGPSVNELFLGNTVSFAGNADQCGTSGALTGTLRDICLAQGVPVGRLGDAAIQDPNQVNPVTFLGGNPNLREEKADNWTVGAVIQPSFVPRLSMTVDYYSIKIKNAIFSGVGTDTIGNLCFTQFNQDYCGLIKRNSLGEIDSFTDQYINSGGLKNRGIDVTAGYTMPIEGFLGQDTKIGFSFSGTRLIKYDITPVEGVDLTYHCAGAFGANCGVPTPKWRHSLRTTLGVTSASLSVQWRYIGKAHDDDPDTLYGSERFKAQNYIDLTAQFEPTENFTLNAGVSNLFDKKPPLAASTQNGGNGEQSNTFPTLYDVLGRSFFMSAKVRY